MKGAVGRCDPSGVLHVRACAVAQPCVTLSDSADRSLPGSSAPGILQAGILEWVAASCPRDLPDPGIQPTYPALAGGFFNTKLSGKPLSSCI